MDTPMFHSHMLLLRCFISLFLFGSYLSPAIAQSVVLTGQLQDQRTHRPIPYVSIGIKGKNVGTVADEKRPFLAARSGGVNR
jgi:hypothetical protein